MMTLEDAERLIEVTGSLYPWETELDLVERGTTEWNPDLCPDSRCRRPFTGLSPWGGHVFDCDYRVDCR